MVLKTPAIEQKILELIAERVDVTKKKIITGELESVTFTSVWIFSSANSGIISLPRKPWKLSRPIRTRSVVQVPAQVPKESGAGPEKTQVFKVTATDGECWVGAEIDGSVLERYLYPGQSTSFSFGQKLQLKVGNATVVQASLNGKPYKIVGQGPVRVIEILAEEQLGQ